MKTMNHEMLYPKANGFKLVLFLIFNLFFAVTLKAQNVLSIDDVLRIGKANNLNIKAKEIDIQAVKSLNKSTRELPKMNINFEYGNTDDFELNDGVSLSQTIPFPNIFEIKKSLIAEQTKGKEWEKQLSEIELTKELRQSYYLLQYLQFNAIQLNKLDSIYLDFIRVSQQRFQAGDISKIDEKTTSIKQGEVKLMMKQNALIIQNSYNHLKNLMQMNEDFEIAMPKEFLPLQINDLLDSSQFDLHPQLQILAQEIKILEGTQKVEKAMNLPDFTFGFNNVSRMGWHEKDGISKWYGRSQRFNSFDIGVNIPLSIGATKSKIQSLELKKQSLDLMNQWQKSLMQTELSNELNQYKLYYEQYQYLKEIVQPYSQELIQSTLLAYKTGEISYVEYLLVIETTFNAELNYLKSILQLNDSVININALLNQ
ncbi:MAG: TolC family protein [Chitinophagales bacterium]|nr:TolC family protein [Chitinophagales bacterium]